MAFSFPKVRAARDRIDKIIPELDRHLPPAFFLQLTKAIKELDSAWLAEYKRMRGITPDQTQNHSAPTDLQAAPKPGEEFA